MQWRKASSLCPENGFKHGQGCMIVTRIKGYFGSFVHIPPGRVVNGYLRVTGIPHTRHIRGGHLVLLSATTQAGDGIGLVVIVVIVVLFQESGK